MSEVFWAWGDVSGGAEARRALLLQQAGARLRNRGLVATFEAWYDAARMQAEGRDAQYGKALGRLRNRLASVAFDAWTRFIDHRRCVLTRAAQ